MAIDKLVFHGDASLEQQSSEDMMEGGKDIKS